MAFYLAAPFLVKTWILALRGESLFSSPVSTEGKPQTSEFIFFGIRLRRLQTLAAVTAGGLASPLFFYLGTKAAGLTSEHFLFYLMMATLFAEAAHFCFCIDVERPDIVKALYKSIGRGRLVLNTTAAAGFLFALHLNRSVYFWISNHTHKEDIAFGFCIVFGVVAYSIIYWVEKRNIASGPSGDETGG